VPAAALIPASELLENQIMRSHVKGSEWNISELRAIAVMFGVSPQAILIRLIGLGSADWNDYSNLRRRFNETAPKRDSSGGNSHRNKVASLGRHYVREVGEAYRSGTIGPLQALRFLNTNMSGLPKILEIADAR